MTVKRCPACNRVFDDVGLKFCLDDGAELVSTTAESEAPPTAVMSGSEDDLPETIEGSTPVIASTERAIPSPFAAPDPANGSLVPLLITVAVLLLIGVIILVAYMVLPSGENIASYFFTRV